MTVAETPVTLANLITISIALAALGSGFFTLLWRRQTDTSKKIDELSISHARYEERLDGRINLLDLKLGQTSEKIAHIDTTRAAALLEFTNALSVHADVMRGVKDTLGELNRSRQDR